MGRTADKEMICAFENVDDELITNGEHSTDEIACEIQEENDQILGLVEDCDSDEDEGGLVPPSIQETLSACEVIRAYCACNDLDEGEPFTRLCRDFEKSSYISKCKKQTKITDYFK